MAGAVVDDMGFAGMPNRYPAGERIDTTRDLLAVHLYVWLPLSCFVCLPSCLPRSLSACLPICIHVWI